MAQKRYEKPLIMVSASRAMPVRSGGRWRFVAAWLITAHYLLTYAVEDSKTKKTERVIHPKARSNKKQSPEEATKIMSKELNNR